MIEFIIKYWIQIFFGIIISFVTLAITKIKSTGTDHELMKESIKVILKSRISEIYEKCKRKQCISIYEKESLIDLYNSYKNLKGNSFVDDLVKDINELETKKNC